MKHRDIINKIKSLWIETFGDSRAYVDMIIDGYYDASLSPNLIEGEDLISSSVVVPFEFEHIIENGYNKDATKRGYYLCGLATVKTRRGEGIMRRIISLIEQKASRDNIDFTFLIPADNHLRNYYRRLGYCNTIERWDITIQRRQNDMLSTPLLSSEENLGLNLNHLKEIPGNITSICTFRLEDINMDNKSNVLTDIINYALKYEKYLLRFQERAITYFHSKDILTNSRILTESNKYIYIRHTYREWKDIIVDFLRDGATIYLLKDSLDCYAGIAILTQDGRVYPIYGDILKIFSIFDNILNDNVNKNCPTQDVITDIRICIFDPIMGELYSSAIEERYGVKYEVKVSRSPYGMAKILRPGVEANKIIINYLFD